MVTEKDPFGDGGSSVMRLWRAILPLPRYIGQVATALQRDDEDDDNIARRLQLAHLLESLHNESIALLEEIHDQDPRLYGGDAHESDKPLEARGLLLTAVAIVSRLRFALCPARAALEGDAQAAAKKILLVNEEAIAIHPRAELYMAMKVHVAQTILATEKTWLAGHWAGLEIVPWCALAEWFTLIGWNGQLIVSKCIRN